MRKVPDLHERFVIDVGKDTMSCMNAMVYDVGMCVTMFSAKSNWNWLLIRKGVHNYGPQDKKCNISVLVIID